MSEEISKSRVGRLLRARPPSTSTDGEGRLRRRHRHRRRHARSRCSHRASTSASTSRAATRGTCRQRHVRHRRSGAGAVRQRRQPDRGTHPASIVRDHRRDRGRDRGGLVARPPRRSPPTSPPPPASSSARSTSSSRVRRGAPTSPTAIRALVDLPDRRVDLHLDPLRVADGGRRDPRDGERRASPWSVCTRCSSST